MRPVSKSKSNERNGTGVVPALIPGVPASFRLYRYCIPGNETFYSPFKFLKVGEFPPPPLNLLSLVHQNPEIPRGGCTTFCGNIPTIHYQHLASRLRFHRVHFSITDC